MPQPTDAQHRHASAWPIPAVLDAAVHGQAGAEEGGCVREIQFFRQSHHAIGRRSHVLRITPIQAKTAQPGPAPEGGAVLVFPRHAV